MSTENSTVVHSGTPAAPGRATGRAYVIQNADDIMAVPAASILVMRILHPHLAPRVLGDYRIVREIGLAPLLPRIAGLVVEEGAILQHATTLARECGLPAVVGLRDARILFRSGDLLEVDGDTGRVTLSQANDST